MRRPSANRDQGDVEAIAFELRVQLEGALHSELNMRVDLALPRQSAAKDDDGHLARATYRVVQLDFTPKLMSVVHSVS